MKKQTQGGKRPGAGRKKITDKRVAVFIYPKQSDVDAVGGKDAAKEIAEHAIEQEAK